MTLSPPNKSTTGRVDISTPLTLRSGVELPNRLVKVSTEEALADADHLPTPRLARLCERFAEGGAGLVLTGAVVIDRRARGRPRDVVIDGTPPIAPFRGWAEATRRRGAAIWMQLNHSGRQTPRALQARPLGPSAIPAVKLLRSFGAPRAMTQDEIRDVIRRFVDAAEVARQAGFSGVQIHAAHGYLLSQFLSPSANLRTDAYGGSPRNRARLLLEVVDAVGERLAGRCGLAVKINASDLHRDGFDTAGFREVIGWLGERPLDFVEVSGGTYESLVLDPALTGTREAYFAEAARSAREASPVPVLLTGGMRTRAAAQRLVGEGTADLVGFARALILDPDLPRRWLAGDSPEGRAPSSGNAVVDFAWYGEQLARLADGRPPIAWSARWAVTARNVAFDLWEAWREKRRPLPDHVRAIGRAPGDAAAWVDAFSWFWVSPRSRLARLPDLLDPDVRLAAPGLRPTTGVDAAIASFDRLLTAFPDLTARVDRWVADGDRLFVELTFSATVGGRWLEWSNVDRFELRGGRAIERVAYHDPAPIRRALSRSLGGIRQLWRLRALTG